MTFYRGFNAAGDHVATIRGGFTGDETIAVFFKNKEVRFDRMALATRELRRHWPRITYRRVDGRALRCIG